MCGDTLVALSHDSSSVSANPTPLFYFRQMFSRGSIAVSFPFAAASSVYHRKAIHEESLRMQRGFRFQGYTASSNVAILLLGDGRSKA